MRVQHHQRRRDCPTACAELIPADITKAFRPRKVPHAGFATVQDDISLRT
jgi:hypothetical protein